MNVVPLWVYKGEGSPSLLYLGNHKYNYLYLLAEPFLNNLILYH
jgi:hypothetical protein